MKPLIQIHHHSPLSSINHRPFFFLSLLFTPTTKWISFWKQNNYPALSQIGPPSASAHVKVCQIFDGSLPPSIPPSPPPTPPPTPPPSHGDVGRLSLLASRPAVWDVLPVLQSGGKQWQAYLPWRSLTWKKREDEKKKKKKEAEGGFTAPLSTFFSRAENPNCTISRIGFIGN